jgi:hypothetical protein
MRHAHYASAVTEVLRRQQVPPRDQGIPCVLLAGIQPGIPGWLCPNATMGEVTTGTLRGWVPNWGVADYHNGWNARQLHRLPLQLQHHQVRPDHHLRQVPPRDQGVP